MFLPIDRTSLKGLFKSWGRVVVHLVGGLGLFILLAVPWFWAETKILGERFLEVFFFSGNMRYYEAALSLTRSHTGSSRRVRETARAVHGAAGSCSYGFCLSLHSST